MPLVAAKCPNCGGTIKVDNTKEAAVCAFCDTPFIVEKAINNYHVENLHADVINMVDERSSKARLEAAETYMKLGKYASAQKAFEDVSALMPQDCRGWWGQIRARTDNLKTVPSDPLDLEKLKELYISALTVASKEDRKPIEEQYSDYWISMVQPKIEGITAELSGIATEMADRSEGEKAEKEKKSAEIASLEARINALEEKKAAEDRKTIKCQNKSSRWYRIRRSPVPTFICTFITLLLIWITDGASVPSDLGIGSMLLTCLFLYFAVACAKKIIAKIGESSNNGKAKRSRQKGEALSVDITRLRKEFDAKKKAFSDSMYGFQRRSADATTRLTGLTKQKAALENLRP